jgi:PAS domain S-box-containing protein
MSEINDPFLLGHQIRQEADFLQALNAAAATIQQAAHADTAVYQAFSEQIPQLDLHGSISQIEENRKYMKVQAVALSARLLKIVETLEKLINFKLAGYRYEIERASLDNQVMETGHAVFLPDNSQKIREVMPLTGHVATDMMIKFFANTPAILAPIFLDERQSSAVLYVAGDRLTEADVPAIAAFANHMSIALQNARLFQDMQRVKSSVQLVNKTLAASKDAVHALVRQIPVGIQVFDPDGLCVDINETCLELFGATDRRHFLRKYNILSDSLAAQIGTQTAVAQVLQGDTIKLGDVDLDFAYADVRFGRTKGKRIANITVFPVFDGKKQVVQFVVLYVDVTERRLAEEATQRLTAELAKQTSMFNAILATTPDDFTVMDRDGRYIYASPRTLSYFGTSLEEFIGKTWQELGLSSELGQKSDQDRAEMLRTGQPITGEMRTPFHNGFIDIEYTLNPMRRSNDEIVGIVNTLRDVTQRKQEEDALRQAQKMESLGILAGGVAHDFNNLLVGMLGQASLALAKSDPNSPAVKHIEKAIAAAEKAAHLTRQLLAYSGRGQFVIRPLNLNQLIDDNYHLFTVALPKMVTATLNLHPSLPLIDADIGQIQQVVMNLILNAAEAIVEKQGAILIATDIVDISEEDDSYWQRTNVPLAPGRYVILEVHDDGDGMDEATLDRIFDPFFSTKFTGRGLGLAAVLGIVRGHKGGMSVSSQTGFGTIFRLVFPESKTAVVDTVHEDATQVVESKIPNTVLVIDDEAGVRDVLTAVLESEGVKVITAVNGEEGIKIYAQKGDKIGLVILDLSMPGIGGIETFNQLHQINPDVRVFLSSGYSEQEVRSRYLDKIYPLGFIQKPFRIDTLLQIITQYFKDNP